MRFAVLPPGTVRSAATLGGVPAERIVTAASNPARALLYLHGGAYVVGSPVTHRAAAAHLTHATGAVGYVLDYRMAPEHPYPAAVDDALAAYRALLDSGLSPDQVVVSRGPYRALRHPSYTGLLAAFLGGGLMFGNALGAAASFLVILAALIQRLLREERALVDALGDEYLAFAKERARLVPFVW